MTISTITIVLECDIAHHQEISKSLEAFLYKQPLMTWKVNIDPFHSDRPLIGDILSLPEDEQIKALEKKRVEGKLDDSTSRYLDSLYRLRGLRGLLGKEKMRR